MVHHSLNDTFVMKKIGQKKDSNLSWILNCKLRTVCTSLQEADQQWGLKYLQEKFCFPLNVKRISTSQPYHKSTD